MKAKRDEVDAGVPVASVQTLARETRLRLEALAQPLGERLGLLIRIRVSEAG